MKATHKRFGTIEVKEITQQALVDFLKATPALDKVFIQEYHGEALKIAIEQGLITLDPSIKPEDVGGMNPGAVKWFSEQLTKAISEATSISPE